MKGTSVFSRWRDRRLAPCTSGEGGQGSWRGICIMPIFGTTPLLSTIGDSQEHDGVVRAWTLSTALSIQFGKLGDSTVYIW